MQVLCEVRCNLYQKMFALIIFLLEGPGGVVLCARDIYPNMYDYAHAPVAFHYLAGGIMFSIVSLAFFTYWSTVCFRLVADADGIFQTNGIFHFRVKWSDVYSYTIEPVQRMKHTSEPVLRDVNAQEIFRPMGMLIRPIPPRIVDERAKFWQYVTNRINERRDTRG